MKELMEYVEQSQMRSDLPELKIGDLVKVYLKVKEGARERLQTFEGYLIAKNGGGCRETITVRRVSYGIGVERTIPLHSPKIDHIDRVRGGEVRRAKLFYLRDRMGKAARIRETK